MLVFLDETSTHTALTRRRARAPRGQRAHGSVPRNHGPNVTLLAVLAPTGIATALAIEGAATREVFDAFVAEFLVPVLRPGQTVVLDNLAVHKSTTAQALIEAAGGRLLFLPPYSPDFNPIEPIFAKVKTALRASAARTPDDLAGGDQGRPRRRHRRGRRRLRRRLRLPPPGATSVTDALGMRQRRR